MGVPSSSSSSKLESILRHVDVNPLTASGRGVQFIGLIIIPLLPLVTLFGYCISNIVHDAIMSAKYDTFREEVSERLSNMELMRTLQNEQAMLVTYHIANRTEVIGSFDHYFHATDTAMDDLNYLPGVLGSKKRFTSDLWKHRRLYQDLVLDPVRAYDNISFYNGVTETLAYWQTREIMKLDVDENEVWMKLFSLYFQTKAHRESGVDGLLTASYFLYGQFPSPIFQTYINSSYLTTVFLNISLENKVAGVFWFDPVEQDAHNRVEVDQIEILVGANERQIVNLHTATLTHSLFTHQQMFIQELSEYVSKEVKENIAKRRNESVQELILNLFGVGLSFCFILFVVMSGNRATISLYMYAISMEKRTRELRKEKRKIDNILQEMLPKAVAYRLRMGKTVDAEEFESATVFFSDIADFSEMSGNIEPIQIVELLNAIYSFMDKQISEYDVYKVETIGCVYMVVSGIPTRNKQRHVSEIARMSLDLLHKTECFKIPYFPQNTLQLRIGFHTGPVVAGVVGNKAPRYCLFGDTVNVASRMQSSSHSRKIHVSAESMTMLIQNGGFTVLPRGQVNIKGKGSLSTYWLIGRTEKTFVRPFDDQEELGGI